MYHAILFVATQVAQDVLCKSSVFATWIAQDVLCNKYRSGCTMPVYLLQRKSPRMYYANLRSSQHGSPKMYYASVCCNKYRSGCTMPVCICCKADRPGCILWQSCLLQAQCCALRRLCLKEGVEESKIEQIVQLDEYVVSTYRCLCTHFCA